MLLNANDGEETYPLMGSVVLHYEVNVGIFALFSSTERPKNPGSANGLSLEIRLYGFYKGIAHSWLHVKGLRPQSYDNYFVLAIFFAIFCL